MNPEVFYLRVGTEQRGPYTVSQIDHQLNSGLIGEETWYWRDGMENPRPVTDLVALRRRKSARSLTRYAKWLVLLVPLLVLARLFGPIIVVGWRETAQSDFTDQAAYWRARDAIRHQAAPPGAVLNFSSQVDSRVELVPEPAGARVWLRTEISPRRPEARTLAYKVSLAYDPHARQWAARAIEEEPL